jgi:hypothetical protein
MYGNTYGDVYNREYAKARHRKLLDEAEERRLIKAYKATQADREPNVDIKEPELAPNRGGFLGLIEWLFQTRGSAWVK